MAEAADCDPVGLEYGFSFVDGYALRFALPRVFLPKPKSSVTGLPEGFTIETIAAYVARAIERARRKPCRDRDGQR